MDSQKEDVPLGRFLRRFAFTVFLSVLSCGWLAFGMTIHLWATMAVWILCAIGGFVLSLVREGLPSKSWVDGALILLAALTLGPTALYLAIEPNLLRWNI